MSNPLHPPSQDESKRQSENPSDTTAMFSQPQEAPDASRTQRANPDLFSDNPMPSRKRSASKITAVESRSSEPDNGSEVIRALRASRGRSNTASVAQSSSFVALPNERTLLAELVEQRLLQQQVLQTNMLQNNELSNLSRLVSSLSNRSVAQILSSSLHPLNVATLPQPSASPLSSLSDPYGVMSDVNILRQLSNLSNNIANNQAQILPNATLGRHREPQDNIPALLQVIRQLPSRAFLQSHSVAMDSSSSESATVALPMSSRFAEGLQRQQLQLADLPPCEEGPLQPYTNRPHFPLGISEDPNWLSEFHCFVRSEIIEVFRASHEDCKSRNNSISYMQAGMRCRFCAHLSVSARAGRSSAFPSSLNQIYQSFTMMLRDHFSNCEAMPPHVREKFLSLKDTPSQGATDSKRYWVFAGMKIGMSDSPDGIIITEATLANGYNAPPFGFSPGRWPEDDLQSVQLVHPGDRPLVSDFLFLLMSQARVVRLLEAERIGNRRSLPVGLPGFGCRFCCDHRRLGHSRMFPARRRTLPAKVKDLYDHLRRCTLCPPRIKEDLNQAQVNHHARATGSGTGTSSVGTDMSLLQSGDREFYDRIWSRLGHDRPNSP